MVTLYKVATASTREVIFEGEAGNFNGNSEAKVSLAKQYKNYDMLGFYLRSNWGGGIRFLYREIPVELIDELRETNGDASISFCWGFASSDDVLDITKQSTTDTELNFGVRKMLITKIVGESNMSMLEIC